MKILAKTRLFAFALASSGIVGLSFGLGSHASADEPKPISVEITSYQRMSQMQDASILAELCGFVHNQTGVMKIQIAVDANTNNPGYYHTSTGTTGNFCQLVRTFGGTAQVAILAGALTGPGKVSKRVSLDSATRK